MYFIFDLSKDNKLIFYSTGVHIALRRIQTDFISRPTYIAHNHASTLNAAINEHTVYFSYLTTAGRLAVGRLIIHGFDNIAAQTLTGDNAETQNTTEYNYSARRHQGAAPRNYDLKMMELSADLSEIVSDSTSTSIKEDNRVLQEKLSTYVERLKTTEHKADESKKLMVIQEQKNEELEKQCVLHLQRISELEEFEQQARKYPQKISELEHQLEDIKNKADKLQKALVIREAQIESAKNQYNELMHVAESYRDEAIKWRSRLSAR